MLIISQHIPKTAGTSLMMTLQRAYGDRLLYHNPDPEYLYSAPREELNEKYDIIHGHIDLTRIEHLINSDTFIFTFLRNPVQRVVSSYFFHSRPETKNDLSERVIGSGMSLKEFANLPGQKNLQMNMVRPIGKERVNFFGIVEDYDNSVAQLGKLLSVDLSPDDKSNMNPEKNVKSTYKLEYGTLRFIFERNLQDVGFYRWAVNERRIGH